jgi:hypothetical protein
MTHGNSDSRTFKRERRNEVCVCSYCKPHRGSNESRSNNHRWVDGKRVPRKGRDKK